MIEQPLKLIVGEASGIETALTHTGTIRRNQDEVEDKIVHVRRPIAMDFAQISEFVYLETLTNQTFFDRYRRICANSRVIL